MNSKDIRRVVSLAVKAGEEIMKIYISREYGQSTKADQSPVTSADMSAHTLLSGGLSETGLPVLSEEGRDIPWEERKNWDRYWLIDPLDGTKEFISGNGEFTVNIALIRQQAPVFGVIYAPVSRELYYTGEDGRLRTMVLPEQEGAGHLLEEEPAPFTTGEKIGTDSFRVVASRSHLNPETRAYLDWLAGEKPEMQVVSRGSSLKFCMMATLNADLYPRRSRTMEWDTAAGQAIAESAGCRVLDWSGKPMKYNKPDLGNPHFIVLPPGGDSRYYLHKT